MAIPDYQTLMLPLLKIAEDEKEHSIQEAYKYLAKVFVLTEGELKELLPSGKQTFFRNRVGWARTYLTKAGLIELPKRGFFKITERGKSSLNENLQRIDNRYLRKFAEFNEFQKKKNLKEETTSSDLIEEIDKTPEESLETSYRTIRNALAAEILDKVKSCSPTFFERLVVELLVAMGYGGTLQDAGKAVGKSGDGGIDGIIKEDRLGLDVIYIQAKRWEGNVSRPEIQKFAGALLGQQARKGVFITTSDFTKEARDFAEKIDSKIILINGEELAELMIDYNVGVSVATTYEIKRIDSDYFSEE